MTKIRTNAFFCEDIRIDIEGKPMFIGVLSPVFWANEAPQIIEELNYVSIFYVDRNTSEFTATLTLRCDGEIVGLNGQGPLQQTFSRPEMEEDEDEWLAMSHLKFRDLSFSEKARLHASLQIGPDKIDCSIQLRVVGPSGQTEGFDKDREAPEKQSQTP